MTISGWSISRQRRSAGSGSISPKPSSPRSLPPPATGRLGRLRPRRAWRPAQRNSWRPARPLCGAPASVLHRHHEHPAAPWLVPGGDLGRRRGACQEPGDLPAGILDPGALGTVAGEREGLRNLGGLEAGLVGQLAPDALNASGSAPSGTASQAFLTHMIVSSTSETATTATLKSLVFRVLVNCCLPSQKARRSYLACLRPNAP